MHTQSRKTFMMKALIDSGCARSCVDIALVNKQGWPMEKLPRLIEILYADGGKNPEATATQFCKVIAKVNGLEMLIQPLVTKLDKSILYLGYDWLVGANPKIDWRTSRVARITTDQTPDHLREFEDVFSDTRVERLPPHQVWDHKIELTSDWAPRGKIYPMSRKETEALDAFLEEGLRTGKLQKSKSPYMSPFFFRLKNGMDELQGIQDYRGLNAITKKDRYPLPLLMTLVEKAAIGKVYTKLDLRKGFNLVRMRKGNEEKAAFVTCRGLFEPLVMQFGLCNVPPMFQRMIDEVLERELATEKVFAYVDDILIATNSVEENRRLTREVLQRLRENQLYCSARKCQFEVDEVDYLGIRITQGWIRISPEQIKAILEIGIPQNKKQLWRALGILRAFRKHIQGYSDIAKPLTRLTGEVPYVWGELEMQQFRKLQEMVTTSPILQLPREGAKFRVETDTLDVATGVMLSQSINGSEWHPVAFQLKTLGEHEANYSTYDKELLAIVRAVQEWRHILLSGEQPFEILTDHRNLVYYRDPQRLLRRQAGWSVQLQDYEFAIRHIPRKGNHLADELSRPIDVRPNPKAEPTNLLPEQCFVNKITAITNKEREMYLAHDIPRAGHPGVKRTLEHLEQNKKTWETMKTDVERYIAGCLQCQEGKPRTGKTPIELPPTPILPGPWKHIGWDIVGPITESAGKDA